jgi:hypothetical protein
LAATQDKTSLNAWVAQALVEKLGRLTHAAHTAEHWSALHTGYVEPVDFSGSDLQAHYMRLALDIDPLPSVVVRAAGGAPVAVEDFYSAGVIDRPDLDPRFETKALVS